jgi:hypothetical protein
VNIWLIASLWVGLALISARVSIRLGISVALVEIGVGVLAGNFLHLAPTDWVSFLASVGSVLLTFLAGAEIDPGALRANLKESLLIGFSSFLAPALGAFAVAFWIFKWNLHAAEIAGVALSTTSVAVVYAVMIESGLNETELGKVILARASSRIWELSSRWVWSSPITTSGCSFLWAPWWWFFGRCRDLRRGTSPKWETASASRRSSSCFSFYSCWAA